MIEETGILAKARFLDFYFLFEVGVFHTNFAIFTAAEFPTFPELSRVSFLRGFSAESAGSECNRTPLPAIVCYFLRQP